MKTLVYFLALCVALVSCTTEKDNTTSPREYEVTYFVKSDGAEIMYNIMDQDFRQEVTDWDTTFLCPGGWNINIFVSGTNLYTGVVVNGDTVDGCAVGDWCQMGYYLAQ